MNSVIRLIVRLIPLVITLSPVLSAHADQYEICSVPVPVTQVTEVDESNVNLVVFNNAKILSKTSAADFILNSYLQNLKSPVTPGSEKWKTVFESCLKLDSKVSAAQSLLLFIQTSENKNSINYDYLDSVLIGDKKGQDLSKLLAQNRYFLRLRPESQNIVFLSIAINDIYWLRANILSKSYKLSGDFQNYAEQKLSQALKVKDITLAKQIAATLEILFFADAEKYRKIGLACNLIGELLESGNELSNSKLLTLVSLRNTDEGLRDVLDPFLVDGFHTLASRAITELKYDEALSMISSIDLKQATPTTYELLGKIIALIEPQSRIFLNETVNAALLNAAGQSDVLKKQLENFYYRRTSVLLEKLDIVAARKSYEYFKAINTDSGLDKDLSMAFASIFLRGGNVSEAQKYIGNFSLTLYDKLNLFLDGYYGNPILYALFLLIPLVIKLSIEFFNKMNISRTQEHDAPEEQPVFGNKTFAESAQEHEEINNFVSSRVSKNKNPLIEEYNDCLTMFELTKGVDLKTIKTAYRNAVRKIHPDLSPNQSPDEASRFVELTKAYDRLRELHRLLGLEK